MITVKGDGEYLQIRSSSGRDRNRPGRNSIDVESIGFHGSFTVSEAGQQSDVGLRVSNVHPFPALFKLML